MAHSRSFLANQKARNAIVGAENLLEANSENETLEMKTPLPGMRPSFTIRTFKMYLKDGPSTKRL